MAAGLCSVCPIPASTWLRRCNMSRPPPPAHTHTHRRPPPQIIMVLSGRLAGLHRGMNTIRSLEDVGLGHSFLFVQDEARAIGSSRAWRCGIRSLSC